jgi:hypothetical protein
MRKTLAALGFAAGIGLICCQSAGAFPANPTAMTGATAPSTVIQAQYAQKMKRHSITKCYRTFVIGDYACHKFHRWH